LEVAPHKFLTSVTDGNDWSALPSGPFTSGERDPGIHQIGDWVASKPVWTQCEEEKNPCLGLCQEPNLGRSVLRQSC